MAQESLIEASGIPYTIVRSTQFFEFIGRIVESGVDRRRHSAVACPSAAHRIG